jgi:hypothetical protein
VWTVSPGSEYGPVLDFRILLKVAYRSADMSDLKFITFTKDESYYTASLNTFQKLVWENVFLKSHP